MTEDLHGPQPGDEAPVWVNEGEGLLRETMRVVRDDGGRLVVLGWRREGNAEPAFAVAMDAGETRELVMHLAAAAEWAEGEGESG